MAVRVSTGYANAILGATSFASIFLNGSIEIRSGAQPASADAAATGILLGRITRDGDAWTAGSPTGGLQFIREGRYARKDPAQNWILTGVATGVAGWFRLVGNAPDAGGFSTTAPRIDGMIGLPDAVGDVQMRLPNLSLSAASLIPHDSWWYAIPPL
jgi:hypothetical protein